MLDIRTNQLVGRTEIERPRSATRNWTAVVFAGGLIGALCGIVGILISLLTMVGVVTRTRVTGSITVALIVIALSSLFGAAHGMDKIHEIEKRERHAKLMEELAKNNRMPCA